MIRVGWSAGAATSSWIRPWRSAPITSRRSSPWCSYSRYRMAFSHACTMSSSSTPCFHADSEMSTLSSVPLRLWRSRASLRWADRPQAFRAVSVDRLAPDERVRPEQGCCRELRRPAKRCTARLVRSTASEPKSSHPWWGTRLRELAPSIGTKQQHGEAVDGAGACAQDGDAPGPGLVPAHEGPKTPQDCRSWSRQPAPAPAPDRAGPPRRWNTDTCAGAAACAASRRAAAPR